MADRPEWVDHLEAMGLLRPNLVVQIDPAHDEIFGAQFMIVTEVKSWGFQGYCKPLDDSGGLAFYRVSFEHCELIGMAVWAQPRHQEG